MRGAGPVLLLVLAVAMGMLAIGQGSSWDRSQEDQADFRSGAPVRVQATEPGMDQVARYAELPGVRDAAPGYRLAVPLSGDRTATVLALDTAHLDDHLMLREDLTDSSPREAVSAVTPKSGRDPGIRLPGDATGVRFALRATNVTGKGSRGPGETTDVSATLEDRYGLAYRMQVGDLPLDGRTHRLTLDLGPAAGPLAVTGIDFETAQVLSKGARHRIALAGIEAVEHGGDARKLTVEGTHWRTSMVSRGTDPGSGRNEPTAPKLDREPRGGTASLVYGTGFVYPMNMGYGAAPTVDVRLAVVRPKVTEIAAVATDRYLKSAGTRVGQGVDVTMGGANVRVRIADSVRALPTTGPEAGASDGTKDGGALLLDLRDLNRALADAGTDPVAPNEWWLSTAPGGDAKAAAALR
ncbi:ABC transporter permease, partial [Streptomyces sp. SID14478]|nr:ABC transporter permease [Streptomyces sp. SID14478]